ncbi:hypothetical protein XENTR_v10010592 [Xenopus tropicalis]|uniref:Achaete-scute family bHLH transcription factor 3 n=1 Tax=Xenopus tropicalis TaxID=8364 RepID=A0A803J3T2_XENTR|nr:achaete-scute homolog 3 [Xenopus tropicalis]KAE8606079.1 hypothetical protein XENTR_v10010592 [Xenopus tropicalis]
MDNFIYALLEILPVPEDPLDIGEVSVPVCVTPTAPCPQDGAQLSSTPHQPSYSGSCSAPSLLSCPTYGKYEGCYGPAYVRKRNERERQRVKCVNEGYTKLRGHLPREYGEKRLSKVQTLRAAICYIRRLQELLGRVQGGDPRVVIQEWANGQWKRSSQV